ncbi:MAG: hypothetical protein IKP00_08395 [Victivallales bacterium]|nr:hypothetical protein [Victivallales bacterium]
MLTDDQAKTYLKRILFLDSPLHGLLLVFSLWFMWAPVTFCLVFCKLCGASFEERAYTAFLFAVVVFCVLVILTAAASYSMASWIKGSKPFRIFSCLFLSLFWGLLDLILLVECFCKKRLWSSLALLLGAFGLFALKVVSKFVLLRWVVRYDTELWICFYLLAAASVLIATGLRPIRRTLVAIAPAVVGVVAILLLHVHFNAVRQSNAHLRKDISELLGRSIEMEEVRKRIESGTPLDVEPLASWMKAEISNNLDVWEGQTFKLEKKREALQTFIASNSEFVEAVHALALQPLQKVAHSLKWDDEPIAALKLPELAKCREAARFLSYEMMANPHDRELVRKDNQEIIALRNMLLQGNTLIEKMVALAIESLRITALCDTLGNSTYSEEEWKKLLEDEVDWMRQFAYAMGDEAYAFQDNLLWTLNHEGGMKEMLGEDRLPYLPAGFMRLFFEKDYNYALHYYRRIIETMLSEKLDHSVLEKIDEEVLGVVRKHGAIFSAMLLPAMSKCVQKADQGKDKRRMAMLAWQVAEYRQRNGRLPEALTEVSSDLLDSIHQKPFILETGMLKVKMKKDEVEIFGFRISAWHDDSETVLNRNAPKVLVPLAKK